ncbi:MAG: tRNA-2-methylthio-N(6)-dimethylallyladenosine synthase [Gemmatimonadota bacterium]|nr:MAG: tRNA-2-methylthio-N(6)-dimethylallyladenosine synthase [Gemmatimonadota bacterium]
MSTPIVPKSSQMHFLQEPGPGRSRSGRRFERIGSVAAPALGSEPGERKTFYVETYGCEMNQYDSDFIASRFLDEGYVPAADPDTADVLLFNTCSIRQGAEDRVRARVQSFAGVKRRRDMVLGVVGCMAQRLGDELQQGQGLIDIVAGTDTYRDLPEMVEEMRGRAEGRIVRTDADAEQTYAIRNYPTDQEGISAFLTIMQGCDKFCTFCIVPYTRGRERSKPWQDVVTEAQTLVDRGARQITLLGQNVNSYRDGPVDFAELLRQVDTVKGLERVFFTSSYPRDMTDEVFEVIAGHRTPVEYLHFPVQSGSDAVLKRMKRRHTVDWYLQRIDAARRIIPDIQFSTDLMVGFPGETEEDFQATLRLVERVRYAECFMYAYSPREGTPATRLTDDLPDGEKARRLETLITLQRGIVKEILEENEGRILEVLVEGPSKKNPRECFGRTRNRFMVVLPEGSAQPGDMVRVRLSELRGSTYRGIPVETGE